LEDIAALYDAHGAKLYAYALSLLGCSADAGDAVQNVFARLQEQWQWPENPGGYLYRAVRNAAYSRLRWRRLRSLEARRLEYDAHFLDADSSPRALEERDRIEQALRSLPPKQRELIVLKVYQDLTFDEIAALLGVSLNTAPCRRHSRPSCWTNWPKRLAATSGQGTTMPSAASATPSCRNNSCKRAD